MLVVDDCPEMKNQAKKYEDRKPIQACVVTMPFQRCDTGLKFFYSVFIIYMGVHDYLRRWFPTIFHKP